MSSVGLLVERGRGFGGVGPMWLLPVLLAPFMGSFLGVLIARLPGGEGIALSGTSAARSQCASCRRVLSPLDLVPVVSFLVLRGRCRTCGAPIGWFHLVIELAVMGVSVWVLAVETEPERIWLDCGLGWVLLTLAWIDWRHFILPDVLTLPLVLAGLVANSWLDGEWPIDGAIGAVLGYAGFRGIELGYRALRGRDGLGQGDAKLMAAAGAWVGWVNLPFVMVGAAVVGIALAVVRGEGLSGKVVIPFGPCIALAVWVVWLYPMAVVELSQAWLAWG